MTGGFGPGAGPAVSRRPAGQGPGGQAVGDQLNAYSGQPAQGVLVAFEHHDVDIGVVTRDVSYG